jgi:hypothetical protein
MNDLFIGLFIIWSADRPNVRLMSGYDVKPECILNNY